MNEISFLHNVKECKKYLEDWDLLKRTNTQNIYRASNSKYSYEFINLARGDNYAPMYRCAIENDDYDYLLNDGSFFQFSYDVCPREKHEVIRLAFYPSIYEYTYEDFLVKELDKRIDECDSDYHDVYQQFISEQDPVIKTVFRYDYDVSLYKKQIHSAAHIHFGNEEGIRIPINSQLRPSAFVKMAIEYYYPNKWKEMVSADYSDIWISSVDTDILEKCLFDDKDEKVPYYYLVDRKK